MTSFADRTGLTSDRLPERYLWTDAFAVCNFLGLARATQDRRFRDLAIQLVDQVHRELGRFHPGDRRTGWISGLADDEAVEHPTIGGLRIGKPMPEREADEPIDPELEWERDGQYFHYLTRWMHALDQLARETREPRYSQWARELAHTAWRAFVYRHGERPFMYWKMSIDLSRPQVGSMGQHDPLDGLLVCYQLQATAAEVGSSGPALAPAIADYAAMVDLMNLATSDPLGIGGLFADAWRVAQLTRAGIRIEYGWHEAILAAARAGLHEYLAGSPLTAPASSRLAFRELGLAIGLSLDGTRVARQTRDAITRFWLDESQRRTQGWLDHEDINDVMLATCLIPEGYLDLHGLGRPGEQPAVRTG